MSEQQNADLQNEAQPGNTEGPAGVNASLAAAQVIKDGSKPQKGAKPQKAVPDEVKLFPVKLMKNYRPVGDFKVLDADGLRAPTADELAKVPAGSVIHLPIDEARGIVAKKIADRNDAIA